MSGSILRCGLVPLEIQDMTISTPAAAGASFLLTAATVPIVRRLALRWRVLDIPNERSSHAEVTPRGAGVAIAIVSTGVAMASQPTPALLAVMVGAISLGAVGLADDRFGLGSGMRLAAQFVSAGLVSLAVLDVPALTAVSVSSVAVATIALSGYVNAFNFMDGINGISAGHAIVAGTFFACLGTLRDIGSLTLGGAVIAATFAGFLPFNAPRARIFLGDAGSYFAGLWLSGLALIAIREGVAIEIAVIPGLLYVADTISTLAVRAMAGHRPGEAHSDHAYQRLARRLKSHSRAAAIATGATALASALALATHDSAPAARTVAAALATTVTGLFIVAGRRPSTVTP